MSTITLSPSKASALLATLINANEPVLLVGAPGVGKSDLVAQASATVGADLMISHPAVADPTDFRGLPWPDHAQGQAHFLPFGDFARAMRAEAPLVWFLDDLGQAPAAVQAAAMQLLLARQVNGHRLPEAVTFVAATNRRTDRAGVSGILTPVLSRFTTIIEVSPDLDDWCAWAYSAGVPTELVGFLRFRPELLHQFDAQSAAADMRNFPCPRTWAAVGRMMRLDLPADLRLPAYAGAVGQGAATELVAYLDLVGQMPSLDGILLDPSVGEIPSDPAVLYAVAAGLAQRATMDNFDQVSTYSLRLHDAGKGEFAALLLRDAYRRLPGLAQQPAFQRLALSPLGRLITGVAR